MGNIVIENAKDGKLFKASGEFGLGDASSVHKELVEALGQSKSCLTLDLAGIESVDLTFVQMLLALAYQARIDGKQVELVGDLPHPLKLAADNLGVSQRDIENVFIS